MIQTNSVIPKNQNKLRKVIRKKVVEILKGQTDVGAAVFPNATVPPWHNELPVILVYPRSEGISLYGQAPKELERDLDLTIEIIATGPEENEDLSTPDVGEKTLEDILDDIAEQVEQALDVDDSLQSTCDGSSLQNTEFEFDAGGGSPIGSCRLTWGITYYTMAPRDTEGQGTDDDFKTSKVEFNIGDDENTRESVDTVVLPT